MKQVEFANVLILNALGEVLVLRRTSEHPTRPLSLDLPGGGTESGESFESAAIREVKEETGLSLDERGLTLACDRRQLEGERNLHGVLYITRLHEGAPPVYLSDEHDAYYWLEAKDIMGLSQFHQESIELAIINGLPDQVS